MSRPSTNLFSLKLLGGASLECSDGALTGRAGQRHRVALLALLAVKPGGMSRDKLIAYLWPEIDAERGRHLLSNSVYVLRQALGEDALASSADAVRLNPEVVRADVRAFEDYLARGELERAVALYGGPFLDGFFLTNVPELEEWIERERDRLAGAYGRAVEALAEAAEGKQDVQAAAGWWKTRAAQDPFDSRVALRLMRALDAAGNRAAVLQEAALHQRRLVEELGVAPSAEIDAYAERLRAEPAPPSVQPPDAKPEPPRLTSRSESSPPVTSAAGEHRAPRGPKRFAIVGVVFAALSLTALWAVWSRPADPGRSIVVLPFVNLTPDPGNEYFSDGLTEEVITRLAAVPGLKVISRTSAMHYKGSKAPLKRIAEELRVAHVLEGSVRQADGGLRIAVQLIDARSDGHVWAESYDFASERLFQAQEEIARDVARALSVEPAGPSRGTSDPVAYELYSRGRHLWATRTREGHARAIEYYQQAIARDSSYAAAYAGLAHAQATAWQFGFIGLPEEEVYSRIKWAAERAIALDDGSADAHTAFAVSLWWQKNWPGVERELRRALEINPGHATAHQFYAILLSGMDRREEAFREGRRAVELDPYALLINLTYAWTHTFVGDYDGAIAQYSRALELNPNWAPAYAQRGLAHARLGQYGASLRDLTKALELEPESGTFLADMAYVLTAAGRREEGASYLHRAKQQGAEPFHIARAYVMFGEPDSAFAWLDRSAWRWPHRARRADPSLDPLRSDPRFARLVERVDREMGLR